MSPKIGGEDAAAQGGGKSGQEDAAAWTECYWGQNQAGQQGQERPPHGI